MEADVEFVANHDGFARFLTMTIESASPEYARVKMPVSDKYLNSMKVVHGGAIAALADFTFATAANMHKKDSVVTLSTAIEYIRAGKIGPLVGEAKARRLGGHILNYDVYIYDGNKRLLAHAMVSGYITSLPWSE